MFPFREPPTKAELVKKSVSDAAHALLDAVPSELEEKFDDLKKTAMQVALQASQVAQHAGEVAAHKIEELGHAAASLGENATETAHHTAQDARESAASARNSAALAAATSAAAAARAQAARESLQERAATLKDSALSLKDSALAAKESLQGRAQNDLAAGKDEAARAKAVAKQLAARQAQTARDKAHKLATQTAQSGAVARDKAQAQAEKLVAKKDELADDARAKTEAVQDQARAAAALAAKKVAKTKANSDDAIERPNGPTEIELSEGPSKLLWVLVGLALGAALMILFAPTSGRRSRAVIKDRLGKVGDGATDAATAASDKAVDIAQRVEGLASTVEAKLAADGEGDDDATIADRVRSTLGHHELARTLERLNVECADGIVTLRGPMMDAATQQSILSAVQAVPGVKQARCDVLLDEPPANPAESVI